MTSVALRVGDVIRCSCRPEVQIVERLGKFGGLSQTVVTSAKEEHSPHHFVLVERALDPAAVALGGQSTLEEAWKDAGAMSVLVDALMERGVLLPNRFPGKHPVDVVNRDAMLLAFEYCVRQWILNQLEPFLELRVAGSYPDLSFFTRKDGELPKETRLHPQARLLRADDRLPSDFRPLVPTKATRVHVRADGTFRHPHRYEYVSLIGRSSFPPYLVSSKSLVAFAEAPWLMCLDRTWPNGDPRYRIEPYGDAVHISTLVHAKDADAARALVSDALSVHAVVPGSLTRVAHARARRLIAKRTKRSET